MKSLPVILGMLLAVSVLFNVVAFVRLADNEAPVVAARIPVAASETLRPVPAAEAPNDVLVAKNLEPAASPREAAAPVVPGKAGGKSGASGATLTQASLRNDPKVREVLQANEAYGAFWRDIDRLSKVRSKFDEPKYQQSVLTATEEFLELGDPNRAQFEEAAKIAANNYAQAKKEADAAKAGLPPKDKANPTSYAAYQQQKDAIDLRYQTQIKAAVDSLKPYLNTNDARTAEFLSNADKWLRTLAPRPVK
jgi:hypothetical protein